MSASKFILIAHRGASAYAPENTICAFDMAVELGIGHIELDVQFSSDGQMVIIHDDDVDRTTDGSGPVADHTLTELGSLDTGSWFQSTYAEARIPSLSEVLERYRGRLYFHIAIKAVAENLSQATADMVRKYGVADNVTITSFQKVQLQEIRAYAPELSAGWLLRETNDSTLSHAKEMGLTSICTRADEVTPELASQLHDMGFTVRA